MSGGKAVAKEGRVRNGRRKVCGKWITMVNLGKGGGWFGKGNWLQWGKFCDIIGYVLS